MGGEGGGRAEPSRRRLVHSCTMSNHDLHWITNYVWGIADDVLRDLRVHANRQQLRADIFVLEKETEGLLGEIIGDCAGR